MRPTYFGHSIGRWDGDALVVDTVGFNEKQWLVGARRLHQTLTVRWTISATSKSSWMPGGEVFEYICQGD